MTASFYDTPGSTSILTPVVRSTANYADFLDALNLHYKSSEYYWQIGTPHSTRDWILNLSVIKSQLLKLLQVVIPILLEENIPFKVIRDEDTATFSLNGHLGPAHLAKIISIYPPTAHDALLLAKKLIPLTKSFKGPTIRTDRYLGGVVYTSWGAHTTIPFSLPPHIAWPFTEIVASQIPSRPKLLNFAYYPTSIIL